MNNEMNFPAVAHGSYPCGNGQKLHSYREAGRDALACSVLRLEGEGYVNTACNCIGDNLFYTYCKEKSGVQLCYYPKNGILKEISMDCPQPTTGMLGAPVTTPMLTQPGRLGASFIAPGMSYFLRTSDGGFIMIDGGPCLPEHLSDCDTLLQLMKEQSPAERPHIHAWVFTHAHGDHMQLACEFLERFHDEITLGAVCANFPDLSVLTTFRMPAEINDFEYYPAQIERLLVKYFPATERIKFHTGQRLLFGDATMEILYTHEDYYPNIIEWGNDTSSAFRITVGKTKLVFLGDCDPILCRFMAEVYGKELKCDILQLAHHGFNGAVTEIYEACDPDICLWAVDGERFANDPRCLGVQKGYEFNLVLREGRARTHYHASETVSVPLT